MKQQLIISSPVELAGFAQDLWQKYIQNRTSAVIFALEGELGAGKTTLTKAMAETMDITDTITSPTFILHDEYPELDHIDAWRMDDAQELMNLGLLEMISKKHVIVIEWADKFKDQITNLKSQNAKLIWIKFKNEKKENERIINYEDLSR